MSQLSDDDWELIELAASGLPCEWHGLVKAVRRHTKHSVEHLNASDIRLLCVEIKKQKQQIKLRELVNKRARNGRLALTEVELEALAESHRLASDKRIEDDCKNTKRIIQVMIDSVFEYILSSGCEIRNGSIVILKKDGKFVVSESSEDELFASLDPALRMFGRLAKIGTLHAPEN